MNTKTNQMGSSERLYSLDALRGFDMLWISGGHSIIITLAQLTGAGWLIALSDQMEHVQWAGFHFYDLIFPLFMFIAGAAIPFAITSKLEKQVPKRTLAIKALKRMLLLVVFGLLYNGVFESGFENARYASVLGQIGLAYFATALITIYFQSFRSWLYWLGGILLGYAVLQLLIPVPGFGPGVLTPEGSINSYIDTLFLPGRLHGKVYDPEGILCIISAVGITLMGAIAGYFLRDKNTGEWQKVKKLAIIGASSIILALIFSSFYPIIKKCWTSTFNLLAGGIGFVLLALFYMVIDVLKYQKWSFFFRVIGMNSIFIYLLYRFVSMKQLSKVVLGWSSAGLGDAFAFVNAIGALTIMWMLLYYMYKKEIFLRV